MIGVLLVLVALSTLGNGGDHPTVMFLTHGLVVAALAIAAGQRPTGRSIDPATMGLVAGYLALTILTAAVAAYGYVAWTAALEVSVFLAVVWLAARVGPDLVPRIAGPLLALGAVHALWILVQRVGQGAYRPAGTFFNTNHAGAWLVAVALVAVASPSRIPAVARWAATALILGALAVTGSRGALVGLVVGAGVLVLYGWRRISRRSRRLVLVGIAALAIAALAMFVERGRSPDPHGFGRTRIWSASLRLMESRPWTGIGPGQFRYAAPAVQFPDPVPPLRYDRTFASTHSDWVRVGCETGVAGVALCLAILGCAAIAVRRGFRSGSVGDEHVGAVAALAALLAQSAFENLSHRPAVYLLAAVLLGGVVSRRSVESAASRVRGRAVWALGAVMLFALADAAPYRAWLLQRSVPPGPPDAAGMARMSRAVRWNPLQPYIRMRLAEAVAADPAVAPLERYAAAREHAEAAVRLNPLDGSLRQQLARLEAAACRALFPDSAARSHVASRFREAAHRAPYVPFIRLEAADFLYSTSDFEGAIREATLALEIEPESVGPRLDLARAVLAGGGAGAAFHAAILVDEAEARAAKYAAVRRDEDYTRGMLDLDPNKVRWLRSRIEAGGGGP